MPHGLQFQRQIQLGTTEQLPAFQGKKTHHLKPHDSHLIPTKEHPHLCLPEDGRHLVARGFPGCPSRPLLSEIPGAFLLLQDHTYWKFPVYKGTLHMYPVHNVRFA